MPGSWSKPGPDHDGAFGQVPDVVARGWAAVVADHGQVLLRHHGRGKADGSMRMAGAATAAGRPLPSTASGRTPPVRRLRRAPRRGRWRPGPTQMARPSRSRPGRLPARWPRRRRGGRGRGCPARVRWRAPCRSRSRRWRPRQVGGLLQGRPRRRSLPSATTAAGDPGRAGPPAARAPRGRTSRRWPVAASTAWTKASSPVPVVTTGGIVAVASGSRTMTSGRRASPQVHTFRPRSSARTHVRVASAPVPAVVGMATRGRRPGRGRRADT